MTLTKCLGIISYFPDDLYDERKTAFINTLNFYNKLFPNIDIVIIAQNWKDFEPQQTSNKITIYKYKNGLGILNARRKLRDVFLKSNYDYLIMSDDDIYISGTEGEKYLNEIDKHPDAACMLNQKSTSLILFAISKNMYSKINIPDNDSLYFEDVYIISACKYLLGSKFAKIACDIHDSTLGSGKVKSTWWNNSYKIKFILNTTYELLRKNFNGIDVRDKEVYNFIND